MRTFMVALLLLFSQSARAQTAIDTPPAVIQEVAAEYPEGARSLRLEAQVLLEVDIDVTGRVTRAAVVTPSDHPDLGFEEAAQHAIEGFTFSPAMAQGRAVPVRIQYRMRFLPPPEEKIPEAEVETSPSVPPPSASALLPPPTGEISGIVLERGTRSPLAGATVQINSEAHAYEVTTDEKGAFTISDLPEGNYEVAIVLGGYTTSKGQETVKARERTELTTYLERTTDNPYDVLVEGSAPKREVTRRKLEIREAQTQPGTMGDPLLALENLPGIAIVPFDGSSISMRGAAPDESGQYIEGFRVPMLFHFIGLRSVIAPGMLDSIDVYPGGAPVTYGRQTGGVLDARLTRLGKEGTHGYVDVSLLDAGAFVETKLHPKVSLALAGRVSYIDQVMKAMGAPMPRYDDYQIRLVARPNRQHQFKLFYLGSDDELHLDTDDLREQNAQVTFGTIDAEAHVQHATLEHVATVTSSIEQRARVGFLHFASRTSLGSDARVNVAYDALLVRENLRFTPAKWLSADVGADVELGRWQTDVLIAPPPKAGEPQGYVDFRAESRAHKGDIEAVAGGVYASAEIMPFSGLSLVPGARVDRQGQIGDFTFDPRIVARYQLLPSLALKAGTGVHHQAPSLDEAAKRFGNPNLGSERALQHSAGVELRPLSFLELDLTGFYNHLDHIAARSDRVVIHDGAATALEYENTGEGRSYGLEVMVRQQLAYRLSGWIAYTLARSERRRTSSDAYEVFDFDQTHNLVLVAAYQLPRHFQLSTRFRYRTGRPTTPVLGATFVSDTDEYAPRFGGTNSARLDSFQQLDLRLDKSWVFKRMTLAAYLDVQNVYNHTNAISVSYNYDYSQRARVSSIPLLPIVGLKAEY